MLYGGERLADIGEGQPVFVVEGELKVEALKTRGRIAVSGDTGDSSKWLPSHAELLRGLPIILWPDSDTAGEKYVCNAAAAIRAENPNADIRIVRPFGPPNGAKGLDVCNWEGNAEDLARLAAGAKSYIPISSNGAEPYAAENGQNNGAEPRRNLRGSRRFGLVPSGAFCDPGCFCETCRAFERYRRRNLLSFNQHAEVAGLDPGEQDRWLDRAVKDGFSVRRLAISFWRFFGGS